MTSIPFYVVIFFILTSFASALFNKIEPSVMADTKKTKPSLHQTPLSPSSLGSSSSSLLSSSSSSSSSSSPSLPSSPTTLSFFTAPMFTHTTDFYLTKDSNQLACGQQEVLDIQILKNIKKQFELTRCLYEFFYENKEESDEYTQRVFKTIQTTDPMDSSAIFHSDVIEEMIKLIDILKRKELLSNPALTSFHVQHKELDFNALLSFPSYLRYFERKYLEDQTYLAHFFDLNSRSNLKSMLKFNPPSSRHRIQVRSLKKKRIVSLITKEHDLPNTLLTLPTQSEWNSMTPMQQVFYLPSLYYHLQMTVFDLKFFNHWHHFCETQKIKDINNLASIPAPKRKVH